MRYMADKTAYKMQSVPLKNVSTQKSTKTRVVEIVAVRADQHQRANKM